VQREADLFQVIGALRAAGRLAGGLHGRQQERDENGDDGDHHQQLDQGEGWTEVVRSGARSHHGSEAPWNETEVANSVGTAEYALQRRASRCV
jgi:hypothetical protein